MTAHCAGFVWFLRRVVTAFWLTPLMLRIWWNYANSCLPRLRVPPYRWYEGWGPLEKGDVEQVWP